MAQGRSTKIISIIKWIRTSRLSIKDSLSQEDAPVEAAVSAYLEAVSRVPDELEVREPRLYGGSFMGGVPREQKMLKGDLPRVIYHRAYSGMRR